MQSLRLTVAITTGNCAGWLSRITGRGRGETLRGRVLLAIDPKALVKLSAQRDIVLVSGTNGKTTTTANLAKILADGTEESVSTSQYGANMTAGIAAVLMQKPAHRLVVLECDELYLPKMYDTLKPQVIVLLNLSRDQLHRTGEVRKVANLWRNTFTRDDVTLVIDRDDPFLEFAASQAGHVLRVTFGGRKHPDAATCPQCAELLDWTSGDYTCSCGLGSELAQVRGDHRLAGPARNTVLAIEAVRLMGGVVPVEWAQILTEQAPDRVATYHVGNREIPTHLAKNPESWRGALQAMTAENVILAVNARGIDGLDTSWLWDVDYSPLKGKRVVCTGERRRDVAYRIHVQGIDVHMAPDFAAAVEMTTEPVQAIASYTAFQDLAAQKMGLRHTAGQS